MKLQVDNVVNDFGLLDRLREYSQPSGDWFSVFHRFVRGLKPQEIVDFNKAWLEQACHEVYVLETSFHVPVICIDARFFMVPCSRSGKLRSMLRCKAMMTRAADRQLDA